MTPYEIPDNGSNTFNPNLHGFSFFDYFGNTTSLTDPNHPNVIWGLAEKPYINNSHIVKVTAYKDMNGNLPVDPTTGVMNPNYNLKGGVIRVLSLADHEKLDNPFAWVRAITDIVYAIRFDGTVDLISNRNGDIDGFIFDPFWGGCYPEHRKYHLDTTKTWDQMRPIDYMDKLETLKKVGSYIPGTYTQYNHNLPSVFSSQNTTDTNQKAGERLNPCSVNFYKDRKSVV